MVRMPANQKIYHITHARNMPQIVQAGALWSDAKRIELGLDCKIVGMSQIKRRRLDRIEVDCCPGTKVGEYVPFYFCPRSVMLYILYMGNHPDLAYTEGQGPMVHLEADLIEGFETPFGMELLTTVHWVAAHEEAVTVEQAIEKTYAWSDRKRMFKEQHIRIAWTILNRKGWLSTASTGEPRDAND